MVLRFYARPLRTLGEFTAADPWNGNPAGRFSIEEFVMMAAGATQATDSSQLMHRVGLRSESGEHMLPESLVELWKRGAIPAERLPLLAQAIAPRLLKDDFNLILHQKVVKTIVLPMIAVFAVLMLVGLFAPVSESTLSLPAALGLSVGFTLLVGGVFWALRQSARRRRVQQMEWLLAANRGVAAGPLPGRAKSYLKRFAALYAMLLGVMLLLLGGAALWYGLGNMGHSDGYDLAKGDLELPADVPAGAAAANVLTPAGEQVTVKLPQAAAEGTRLRLPGKGIMRTDGTRGDLYLKVHFVR